MNNFYTFGILINSFYVQYFLTVKGQAMTSNSTTSKKSMSSQTQI